VTTRGLQEEVNEATVQYVGGALGSLKARIACQDEKSLRRGENSRYDFQIITFQDLKNARSIADIHTP